MDLRNTFGVRRTFLWQRSGSFWYDPEYGDDNVYHHAEEGGVKGCAKVKLPMV
jgi:hypothetical protein